MYSIGRGKAKSESKGKEGTASEHTIIVCS